MKKRYSSFLCLVLATVIFATCVFTGNNPSAANRNLPTGDVNGDYKINAADALLILQYSVGKIPRFPIDDPSFESNTDTPSSDVVSNDISWDSLPDGKYNDYKDFLADAVKDNTTINPNLVYTPTAPAGFELHSVDAHNEYTAYGFDYRAEGYPKKRPNETTVIGMHFAFYDGNDNFYKVESFSATEQAQELAKNKFNKHITVFTLPDGREVLMYATTRRGYMNSTTKYTGIYLATTINGKFVFISASITSKAMWDADVANQYDVLNGYFSEFMEQKAQSEFTRLLNGFRFEAYDFSAQQ